MSGFKAVGFDLDGTFMRTHVDYARLNEVDRTVCEAHGIPFDEIDFGGAVKRPRYPIRDWMSANGRISEWDEIYREMDDLCTEIECEFVEEAEPFRGSVESIAILRSKGLRVGLLTRGSREYAQRALGPVFDEFDVVMGRDHTTYDEAKPSPIAMEQFADGLGVEPSEILYIGDNRTDWESAVGAGATFVGVLTGSGSVDMWRDVDPSIRVIDVAGDVVELL